MREGRFASNTAVATLLAGVARGMEAVHAHINPNPNPYPNPNPNPSPNPSPSPKQASDMLGCADVQELLEKRSITVGGETTKIELSPQQALLSRDAVVKIVYARLFGFVVSCYSPISP